MSFFLPAVGLTFSPSKFPYRNQFEPFLFRLITLLCLGLAYILYIALVIVLPPLLASDAVVTFAAVGGSLPLMLCIAALLYFAKPDFWVKVDRVAMELLLTKTRSGGYCSSGPQDRVPLSQVRDITTLNVSGCGAAMGRTWTIEANLVDGSVLRLTPLCDLTQTRAYTEAGKLMNAIRLSRGEPMVLTV